MLHKPCHHFIAVVNQTVNAQTEATAEGDGFGCEHGFCYGDGFGYDDG